MSHDLSEDRFVPGPEFDFYPGPRVVFGVRRLDRLGELARELGAERVLLCTDGGIRAAGHEDRATHSLATAGLHITIFDDIHPNPTTEDVERGLAIAREGKVDLLIGLGGGSSMDCAKGINFLLTNGGKLQDYVGAGRATKPMLPMIGIPTTSGTGSEAQSYAVIGDPETHVKMACGDRKATFRTVILDPELTLSMPNAVATATGIDAISHALETYVTRPRNAVSTLFSRRAWQMLATNFPRVLEEPGDITARGEMQVGANFAGAAIENSMLGATHALANPLTARFDIPHGLAIGVMLPHVVRLNACVAGHWYGELAGDINLCKSEDPEAGERLADHLATLFTQAGCPRSLKEWNVEEEALPSLAEMAAKQWTGQFNPRPVDSTILEELYRCAM